MENLITGQHIIEEFWGIWKCSVTKAIVDSVPIHKVRAKAIQKLTVENCINDYVLLNKCTEYRSSVSHNELAECSRWRMRSEEYKKQVEASKEVYRQTLNQLESIATSKAVLPEADCKAALVLLQEYLVGGSMSYLTFTARPQYHTEKMIPGLDAKKEIQKVMDQHKNGRPVVFVGRDIKQAVAIRNNVAVWKTDGTKETIRFKTKAEAAERVGFINKWQLEIPKSEPVFYDATNVGIVTWKTPATVTNTVGQISTGGSSYVLASSDNNVTWKKV
jgi:hypothetical protein